MGSSVQGPGSVSDRGRVVDEAARHVSFQQTQPRVVKEAGQGDPTALSLLCQWYWYPIYSFLRYLGTGHLDARDVTQGFFARMLEPARWGEIAKVDPGRGRFRCWLRACAKYYLLNELDRARAKTRGGDAIVVSVDAWQAEDRFRFELRDPGGVDPDVLVDRIIDREMAVIVVERALARLREQCPDAEESIHFLHLQQGLMGAANQPTDEALAAEVGKTLEAVRKGRFDMRKRFRLCLREEVGTMVDDPTLIDDEIRQLRDALGHD